MHSEKRYYVYILGSESGTLYTGVTNSIPDEWKSTKVAQDQSLRPDIT